MVDDRTVYYPRVIKPIEHIDEIPNVVLHLRDNLRGLGDGDCVDLLGYLVSIQKDMKLRDRPIHFSLIDLDIGEGSPLRLSVWEEVDRELLARQDEIVLLGLKNVHVECRDGRPPRFQIERDTLIFIDPVEYRGRVPKPMGSLGTMSQWVSDQADDLPVKALGDFKKAAVPDVAIVAVKLLGLRKNCVLYMACTGCGKKSCTCIQSPGTTNPRFHGLADVAEGDESMELSFFDHTSAILGKTVEEVAILQRDDPAEFEKLIDSCGGHRSSLMKLTLRKSSEDMRRGIKVLELSFVN
eukprot:jgi/Mesvir1/2756/Mv26336-RA.1